MTRLSLPPRPLDLIRWPEAVGSIAVGWRGLAGDPGAGALAGLRCWFGGFTGKKPITHGPMPELVVARAVGTATIHGPDWPAQWVAHEVGRYRKSPSPEPTARPSPINHGAGKTPAPENCRRCHDVAAIAGVKPLPPVVVPVAQPRPQPRRAAGSGRAGDRLQAEAGGARLLPMWPHHARPTHRYCGKPCEPDKHYCSEHQARCYTRSTWVPGVGNISAEAVAT